CPSSEFPSAEMGISSILLVRIWQPAKREIGGKSVPIYEIPMWRRWGNQDPWPVWRCWRKQMIKIPRHGEIQAAAQAKPSPRLSQAPAWALGGYAFAVAAVVAGSACAFLIQSL